MSLKTRMQDLEEFIEDMDPYLVIELVRLCRDFKDDMFLELALAAKADFLITGDADLLALHPFNQTAILTPATYLAR